jgi:hypothetical protein
MNLHEPAPPASHSSPGECIGRACGLRPAPDRPYAGRLEDIVWVGACGLRPAPQPTLRGGDFIGCIPVDS